MLHKVRGPWVSIRLYIALHVHVTKTPDCVLLLAQTIQLIQQFITYHRNTHDSAVTLPHFLGYHRPSSDERTLQDDADTLMIQNTIPENSEERSGIEDCPVKQGRY